VTGVVEVDGITKGGDETAETPAEQKGECMFCSNRFFPLIFLFTLWGGVGGEAGLKVILRCSKTDNAVNIFSREGCSRFLA